MEDRNHIFTCSNEETTKVYNKSIRELDTIMEGLKIAPEIQTAVIGILKRVRSGNKPTPYSVSSGSFRSGLTISGIIRVQAEIGWINFLCGRWSAKWKEA